MGAYSQYRALFRKNISLQWRQKKTNCCQIGFPVALMILLGIFKLVFDTTSDLEPVVLQSTSWDPVLNNTWPCGALYTNNTFQGCGLYNHLWFSNPNDIAEDSTLHSGGVLTNGTQTVVDGEPVPTKEGFIGHINQNQYISVPSEIYDNPEFTKYFNDDGDTDYRATLTRRAMSTEPQTLLYVPFFDFRNETDKINEDIFELRLQHDKNNISIAYSIPTGIVKFERLNLTVAPQNQQQQHKRRAIAATDPPQLHYILQMQNEKGGLNINFGGSNVSLVPLYPFWTQPVARYRTVQYMSWIHGAFMSTIFGQSVDDQNKITIQASLGTLPQLEYFPNFPIDASSGLSLIPDAVGFLLPVFVYILVLEKSEKHLEMMKMQGMSVMHYWMVNFIFDYILYLLVLAMVLATGFAFLLDVFLKTNPLVYMTLFLLWGVTQIAMAFALSTLFSSAKTASVLSYLIVFLGLGISYDISFWAVGCCNLNWTYYFIYMLFPPFTLMRGVYLLEYPFMTQKDPLGWEVFTTMQNNQMAVVYFYFIGQAIVLFILTAYLHQILPSFGVKKSPFFPFYWLFGLCKSKDNKEQNGLQLDDTLSTILDELDGDDDCKREEEKAHDFSTKPQPLLRLVDMHKKYKQRGKDDFVALKRLSLAILDGECFGLLGPNGAGKTTLASILCGMAEPTTGYAVIAGCKVPEEVDRLHQLIGYCPQYDVLWDDLTVEEHLLFYFRLKGTAVNQEQALVDDLAKRVLLENDKQKLVSELSGGMKRRLSVAISLVGNPRFVLLDEPTTGVDPVSRRSIWDIISSEKNGRCIMITTHSMEEADVLCSRIGIMAKGQLLCIGNQTHLKKKYGTGYVLSVTTSDHHTTNEAIKQLYPLAILESSLSDILHYLIPSAQFDLIELINHMENKEQYAIVEWGINQTSLEEVFLKIVGPEETGDSDSNDDNNNNNINNSNTNYLDDNDDNDYDYDNNNNNDDGGINYDINLNNNNNNSSNRNSFTDTLLDP